MSCHAYLVVPAENTTTGPGPHLNFACNSTTRPNCGSRYPCACIDEDQVGSDDGVTSVQRLLLGVYEYWVQLSTETDAGDLTIVVRDKGGRVVQQWSSPASPSIDDEHS